MGYFNTDKLFVRLNNSTTRNDMFILCKETKYSVTLLFLGKAKDKVNPYPANLENMVSS